MLLISPGAAAADLNGVRLWSENGNTRVVLDLSQRVDFKLFPLRAPDRLVIDLSNTACTSSCDAGGSGVVELVRSADRGHSDLRVVLDLNSAARPTTKFVGGVDGVGERLVIDLAEPSSRAPKKEKPAPQAPKARAITVAIDPGHGGRDPGALGRNKTREKDVVLSIAKRLKRRVDAEPGMQAFMIRDNDTLVEHRERMESARRAGADIFISIHADAFDDKRARGSSVYALSLSAANNEATRRLVAAQNGSSARLGKVILKDKDPDLVSLLMDLSQNATISASLKAGSEVLAELAKIGNVHKRRVQQANFAVLRSPDVPSILVETAFITNPAEERKLKDAKHQEQLAQAILSGVKRYFQRNPPPGTFFAQASRPKQQRAQVKHVISRGDTLSEIAQRYDVRISSLRKANKLSNDRVRIGQVLTIPPTS